MGVTPEQLKTLTDKAKRVRIDILKMLTECGSGHTGGSLSAADIATALYFYKMKYDPKRPDWKAVVTAEEHSIIGGLGGAVAEVLAESAPTPLVRVGVRDAFGTSGDQEGLLRHYGMSAEHIAAAVKEVIQKKKSLKS